MPWHFESHEPCKFPSKIKTRVYLLFLYSLLFKKRQLDCQSSLTLTEPCNYPLCVFWKEKQPSSDNIMIMLVEMHMKLVYFNWKDISFRPTLLVPLSSSADVSRDVVNLSRRSLSFHTLGEMLPVEAAKQPFKKLNHTPSQNALGKGWNMMFVIFRACRGRSFGICSGPDSTPSLPRRLFYRAIFLCRMSFLNCLFICKMSLKPVLSDTRKPKIFWVACESSIL